jgi:ATP-binding cassette subfamily B protein/ATP-binding cassette subfamily C protein
MRLDDIDAGRIMYGDSDITSYSLSEWRKMFSYTSTSQLRNKTLLENVRYAGADVTAEDVDRVLRESGLNHVADAFKPRYDKTVGGKMLRWSTPDRMVDAVSSRPHLSSCWTSPPAPLIRLLGTM